MLKRLLKRLNVQLGHRSIADSSLVPMRDKTGKVVGLMDKVSADFLASPKPTITQSDVDQVFSAVTLVRVVHKVVGEDRRFHAETILNVTDAEAFSGLHPALKIIEDENPFHLLTVGDYLLEFFQADKLLSTIELLSLSAIRWDLLHGDAHLQDGLLLGNWLAERGVEEPLTRYRENQERAKKLQEAEERWKQAMPTCLLPFWDEMRDEALKPEGLQPILKAAYPDSEQRVLELFCWYGSGEGAWSGYPTYESYPEQLLFNFSTTQLVSILMTAPLTESHLEGAARFFAGWEFYKRRSAERALLPLALKQQLLQHSLKSPIEDKRERALAAFST